MITKKVLIFGASGQIGRYCIRRLVRNNYKVIAVTRNTHQNGYILKKNYKKIVISPGPGNPNQAGNCLKIVKDLHKRIPILGVCLGHQVIGQVFGGKIKRAKNNNHKLS